MNKDIKEKLAAIKVRIPVGEFNYEWTLDEMLGDAVDELLQLFNQEITKAVVEAEKGYVKLPSEDEMWEWFADKPYSKLDKCKCCGSRHYQCTCLDTMYFIADRLSKETSTK